MKKTKFHWMTLGVILLYFYFFPYSFSSICTKELCGVRDNMSIYNDSNVQVLGISVDSLYTLKKFKQDLNLDFPLLSDFNKTASTAYNVLYETFPTFEMKGVGKRAAYVIDKIGIVRYTDVCARPVDLPDFEAIQQILSGLN